jgi:hypothetical protein
MLEIRLTCLADCLGLEVSQTTVKLDTGMRISLSEIQNSLFLKILRIRLLLQMLSFQSLELTYPKIRVSEVRGGVWFIS